MEYEYEKENIRKLNSYNVLSGGANITKPIDELQEVYKKAKAFDELKTFVNENSIENINDDLYDAGYVEACNDILEKIRMEDE
ncbi:hypothetical protein [Staphylococcus equorum]|uniref:hypothetical protein n=1 Tax=Staphylococcus equorum TaxID=246432 RepID=UPI002555717E|nr:hypothetical protein [Staphylococcus equorum]MDK9849741.1 hypothetical protein [Staphylococcus equorum]